jgi:hypothetical protein
MSRKIDFVLDSDECFQTLSTAVNSSANIRRRERYEEDQSSDINEMHFSNLHQITATEPGEDSMIMTVRERNINDNDVFASQNFELFTKSSGGDNSP